MTRLAKNSLRLIFASATITMVASADGNTGQVDQGSEWTAQSRTGFYHVDQGSRMIPLAWLKALKTADGRPFLTGAMSRYGFLADGAEASESLPVGFTTADSPQGPIVGMTCAACHTREITVGRESYRIDGAPAFIDFGAFIVDLDDAVGRILESEQSFLAFSKQALGPTAAEDPASRARLKSEVDAWWARFHAWVSLSVPKQRAWGPTRLDAMGMIFNRVAGLDLGPAPTHVLPANIARADAPVRYPFLWNSAKQDLTQWAAFDPNGNDTLALVRNLGQLYGVFGEFRPSSPTGGSSPLNRNYLSANSTNFEGLGLAEAYLKRIGPPKWPWAVDLSLAKQGEPIFRRECAQCHGVTAGASRPPTLHTWKTRVLDVGTDTRQWTILTRQVQSGSMDGAALPGEAPLQAHAGALAVLRVAILGTLIEKQTEGGQTQDHPRPAAPAPASGASVLPKMHEAMHAMSLDSPKNVYEARVLEGIWAAAPFLHNGSVPTLADLLEPPERRRGSFAIGPVYDPERVGLASQQNPGAFTLRTTGCDDRGSGDSNCGHVFGTTLPAAEKRALLEYLKTL